MRYVAAYVSVCVYISLYVVCVCMCACMCAYMIRKRRKFTEHSDDGFSWLSLLRFSVNGALDAMPEAVALYSETHSHIEHCYRQHRHEKEYETAELVKRELGHVRQQHGTHRRFLGIATGSCKQMRETLLFLNLQHQIILFSSTFSTSST